MKKIVITLFTITAVTLFLVACVGSSNSKKVEEESVTFSLSEVKQECDNTKTYEDLLAITEENADDFYFETFAKAFRKSSNTAEMLESIPEYISVSSDENSLVLSRNYVIEDNTSDIERFIAETYETGQLDAAIALNSALGFDDATTEKMRSTRELDGTQTDEADGVAVSWTYSASKGLKAIYELE